METDSGYRTRVSDTRVLVRGRWAYSYRKTSIDTIRLYHVGRRGRRLLHNGYLLNRYCVLTNALPRVVEGADPYETEFSLTDIASCPTACRGSSEPLPYKITATLSVWEGLAPPGTFPVNVC